MTGTFDIKIERLGNGYLIEVDKYRASEQRYVAQSAAHAIRLVSAALLANEETLAETSHE